MNELYPNTSKNPANDSTRNAADSAAILARLDQIASTIGKMESEVSALRKSQEAMGLRIDGNSDTMDNLARDLSNKIYG
jgi:hypothetical protein